MGFLKILPLLIPLLIFLLPILVRTYLKSKFTKTNSGRIAISKFKNNKIVPAIGNSFPKKIKIKIKEITP